MSERKKSKNYIWKWHNNVLHIFDYTYRQNFWFFYAQDYKTYLKILWKRFKIKGDPVVKSGKFSVYEQHGYDVCFIWCPPAKGNLVHECFHAISYTLRRRGLPLNDDTEEAYCYSLQFLVKTIMEALKSKRR